MSRKENRARHNAVMPDSDAAKAAEIDAPALPPSQIGDAADNARNTEEANERSEAGAGELNEPGTVAELKGGAGALPNSLEPAAQNARLAEVASALQAEVAKRPDNPNEVYRKALREIAAYVGPEKTSEILSRYFGVNDVEKVGVTSLGMALDELHRAADEPKAS